MILIVTTNLNAQINAERKKESVKEQWTALCLFNVKFFYTEHENASDTEKFEWYNEYKKYIDNLFNSVGDNTLRGKLIKYYNCLLEGDFDKVCKAKNISFTSFEGRDAELKRQKEKNVNKYKSLTTNELKKELEKILIEAEHYSIKNYGNFEAFYFFGDVVRKYPIP